MNTEFVPHAKTPKTKQRENENPKEAKGGYIKLRLDIQRSLTALEFNLPTYYGFSTLCAPIFLYGPNG